LRSRRRFALARLPNTDNHALTRPRRPGVVDSVPCRGTAPAAACSLCKANRSTR
jgi:hypothetical protein